MNKIMYRILSKNVYECIDWDLYWFGIDYIKEVYRNNMSFNTLNNEYVIKFSREDCQLWYNNTTCHYICSMKFFNNLNIEVLSIDFSEVESLAILDALYVFEDFNMADITIPINSGSSNMMCYQIKLERQVPNMELIKATVLQYNPMNGSLIPRVVFHVTANMLLNDLLYQMYFAYLIDIDNGENTFTESFYQYLNQV